MSAETKIELRGLAKRFGAKTVLDGIDLKVGKPEYGIQARPFCGCKVYAFYPQG